MGIDPSEPESDAVAFELDALAPLRRVQETEELAARFAGREMHHVYIVRCSWRGAKCQAKMSGWCLSEALVPFL